jgi:hypothetical protein
MPKMKKNKKTYRVKNWREYNQALKKRGSITLWLEEKSIAQWHQKSGQPGKEGRPFVYGDVAIECILMIKIVFRLPLRALEGLMNSLIKQLGLPIQVPCYTTISRREKTLEISLKRYSKRNEPLHLVVDSSGLKVFGEGEWKVRKHGYSKRRTWRKIHLGIDEASGEIRACKLTENDIADSEILPYLVDQIEGPISQTSADGAYDTFAVHQTITARGAYPAIPPRKNARIAQHGNSKAPPLSRDTLLREIRNLGRKAWKIKCGYHRRSLAETAIYRFKQLLGATLMARDFLRQNVEAILKCNILNRITMLGMPLSYPIT